MIRVSYCSCKGHPSLSLPFYHRHHSLFAYQWNCSFFSQTAVVTSIIKKPGSDPNKLNFFVLFQISHFISKILEIIVAAQLHTHLFCNNLHEQFQSGFRPLHSTETALLKITNDLLLVADSGLLSILLLLDWVRPSTQFHIPSFWTDSPLWYH